MWHQPCALSVHHFSGSSKPRYKKLFTHVESHASAVSLLESREERYVKAINSNNNDVLGKKKIGEKIREKKTSP